MSFSSGVQGSLRGSSCYNSFELCAFSFVWFLEVKKKCSSRSADLSFLCNFKPISSPFLHEQSKVQNFFILVFIFFSPWLQGGDGNAGDKRQHRGCSQGPEPPASLCPVLLLESALSAPSFFYFIAPNLWAELLTGSTQVEDSCPHHGILQAACVSLLN